MTMALQICLDVVQAVVKPACMVTLTCPKGVNYQPNAMKHATNLFMQSLQMQCRSEHLEIINDIVWTTECLLLRVTTAFPLQGCT